MTERAYGAQSMTADLREVLVERPGPGVRAGVRRSGLTGSSDRSTSTAPGASTTGSSTRSTGLGVDRPRPRRAGRQRRPGPRLRLRPAARLRPRRDPAPARASRTGPASRPSSRPGRRAAGIPTAGRIEAPGTIEGGDTFWLRPDLLCIGRTLRTNDAGARQLARDRRRRRADLRRPVLAAARPSSSTCCRSSRRSPTTSRSSTCRSCRSGCGS